MVGAAIACPLEFLRFEGVGGERLQLLELLADQRGRWECSLPQPIVPVRSALPLTLGEL